MKFTELETKRFLQSTMIMGVDFLLFCDAKHRRTCSFFIIKAYIYIYIYICVCLYVGRLPGQLARSDRQNGTEASTTSHQSLGKALGKIMTCPLIDATHIPLMMASAQ